MQSIAVLDLKTNQITEFPDKRFGEDVHQSYFLGLVFGSDGKHLYASVGSITDPTGEKPGDTGNGIAVYSFTDGKVAPGRFITIAPQPLAAGKKLPSVCGRQPRHCDSLSSRIGAGFFWRSRPHSRGQQSFRQRRAARYRDRKSASTFRPEHERSRAVVVPLYLHNHARRPPRLVQLVECIPSCRIGSDRRARSSAGSSCRSPTIPSRRAHIPRRCC